MRRWMTNCRSETSRSGPASPPSAVRFYEAEGSGARRLDRMAGNGGSPATRCAGSPSSASPSGSVSRLDEIRHALEGLPTNRTPTHDDWAALSASWRPRLDAQIAVLVASATNSTRASAAAASRSRRARCTTPTTRPLGWAPAPATCSAIARATPAYRELMTLTGEYEPSTWDWVREQVETYERTDGQRSQHAARHGDADHHRDHPRPQERQAPQDCR